MWQAVAMKLALLLIFAATMLCAAEVRAQGRGSAAPRPAAPAPRWPDGTINLGAPPGQAGLWEGGEPLATNP
jgi:hypothetical protein